MGGFKGAPWKAAVLPLGGALALILGCGFGEQGDSCQFATHADAETKGGKTKERTDPVIKGYVGRGNEKFYLVPGTRLYKRTAIDEAKGMRWFCTEKEAEAAGWSKAM